MVRGERKACMSKYKNDNPEKVQVAVETAKFSKCRFSLIVKVVALDITFQSALLEDSS